MIINYLAACGLEFGAAQDMVQTSAFVNESNVNGVLYLRPAAMTGYQLLLSYSHYVDDY